ncbi:CLUMA_CG007646, isoform A [Clunio marinus]|uniref:CLUMA_CG007646, isoform A n=1 Tax=Clunio marinus TaxID=568069 RepID=A0A1J1I1N3_9DIPT|nr:CLUMA_CG007646, isoform A [Clunio marinus]
MRRTTANVPEIWRELNSHANHNANNMRICFEPFEPSDWNSGNSNQRKIPNKRMKKKFLKAKIKF